VQYTGRLAALIYGYNEKSKVIWKEAKSLSPVRATARFYSLRGSSNLHLQVLVREFNPKYSLPLGIRDSQSNTICNWTPQV